MLDNVINFINDYHKLKIITLFTSDGYAIGISNTGIAYIIENDMLLGHIYIKLFKEDSTLQNSLEIAFKDLIKISDYMGSAGIVGTSATNPPGHSIELENVQYIFSNMVKISYDIINSLPNKMFIKLLAIPEYICTESSNLIIDNSFVNVIKVAQLPLILCNHSILIIAYENEKNIEKFPFQYLDLCR